MFLHTNHASTAAGGKSLEDFFISNIPALGVALCAILLFSATVVHAAKPRERVVLAWAETMEPRRAKNFEARYKTPGKFISDRRNLEMFKTGTDPEQSGSDNIANEHHSLN
jgi:hypothetical protein